MKRLVMIMVVLTAILLVFAQVALATAHYVYHEQTNNDPGCGSGAYMNPLAPTAGQAVNIRFKVEYQFYTNEVRVYYTTDGSNPTGAFGVGSGTTQVIAASYNCTFGPSVVDVVNATIPGQSGGATVKYKISAWHSGGGGEIFANSDNCGNSGCATTFSYNVPMAATLASFDAAQAGEAIRVSWDTVSELNNLGFNLWRGTTPNAPDQQLNASLIPSAAPGSGQGFHYEWLDQADLVNNTTYYYWLEDMDISGQTTRHGPVSATYEAPTAVRLSGANVGWSGSGAALLLCGAAGLLALALAMRKRHHPA